MQRTHCHVETSVWDDGSWETSCRDENTVVMEAWMWSAVVLRRWLNCIQRSTEFLENIPLTIMRCPHPTHSDHLNASDIQSHQTKQCPPMAFIVHQCCFSFMLSLDANSTSVGRTAVVHLLPSLPGVFRHALLHTLVVMNE